LATLLVQTLPDLGMRAAIEHRQELGPRSDEQLGIGADEDPLLLGVDDHELKVRAPDLLLGDHADADVEEGLLGLGALVDDLFHQALEPAAAGRDARSPGEVGLVRPLHRRRIAPPLVPDRSHGVLL
jgi:hypothetical protein